MANPLQVRPPFFPTQGRIPPALLPRRGRLPNLRSPAPPGSAGFRPPPQLLFALSPLPRHIRAGASPRPRSGPSPSAAAALHGSLRRRPHPAPWPRPRVPHPPAHPRLVVGQPPRQRRRRPNQQHRQEELLLSAGPFGRTKQSHPRPLSDRRGPRAAMPQAIRAAAHPIVSMAPKELPLPHRAFPIHNGGAHAIHVYRVLGLILVALLSPVGAAAQPRSPSAGCDRLASVALPNTTVASRRSCLPVNSRHRVRVPSRSRTCRPSAVWSGPLGC